MYCEVLSELIKEKGCSLRALNCPSITHNMFSRYLRGVTIPNIETSIKIAKFFNCSLDYLFGLTLNRGISPSKNFSSSSFVKNYNKLLKENNLNHTAFSLEIGISEASIRKWKNGSIPSSETIAKISKGLSASIEQLIF